MPNRSQVVVEFSGSAHSLESVKKAAYKLSAQFSFEFQVSGGQIIVGMFPLQELATDEIEEAKDRFRNEVLDQELRVLVAMETAAVRNAILAHAFSRSGLQDEQVSDS